MENSRSGIMRNQEWNSSTAELDTLDLAKLVLGLLVLDAVDGEATLGIVDEAEVLASLLEGDDVHEAGRVGHVGADLAINLDETLHEDRPGLAVVQGILETVADEDDERHALAELVRTSRRAGSVHAGQLVQQPVRRSAKALLVLLTAERNLSVLSLGVRCEREIPSSPSRRREPLRTSHDGPSLHWERQECLNGSCGILTYGPRPILNYC